MRRDEMMKQKRPNMEEARGKRGAAPAAKQSRVPPGMSAKGQEMSGKQSRVPPRDAALPKDPRKMEGMNELACGGKVKKHSKGGKVKKYAKGGKVRGVGCATKGTKFSGTY